MKLVAVVALLFAGSAGNLKAAGIVLCYDGIGNAAGVLRPTACATQSNFSVLPATDFVDWGLPTTVNSGQAYGLGTSVDPIFNYSPAAHAGASWNARSSGLVTAGVNTLNGFTGTDNLQRMDQGNFLDGLSANIFTGHFNAQPNPGAGSPYGDHLVGMSAAQGPMRIDFDKPVVSVGFYISTNAHTDFIATIKAYDHVNPLATDVPLFTYTIDTNGAGGGGICNALATGLGPACNDAPFIALDGNNIGLLGHPMSFMSIVISTDDTSGFFIDSMYMGEVLDVNNPSTPEPASAFMIGGGVLLLAMASRKLKSKTRV